MNKQKFLDCSVVELDTLLHEKADPNTHTSCGTLAELAFQVGEPEKFNLLVKHKADISNVSVHTGWKGSNPLHDCLFPSRRGPIKKKVFALLVQRLQDSEASDYYHHCIRIECNQKRFLNRSKVEDAAACLRLLLSRTKSYKNNLLVHAARYDAVECIREILRRFPHLCSAPEISLALCKALHHREADAAKALLRFKANPNYIGTDGRTPLYQATAGQGARPGLVSLLIQKKADVNHRAYADFLSVTELHSLLMHPTQQRDIHKKIFSPLSVAKRYDVAKILLLNGADTDGVVFVHDEIHEVARIANFCRESAMEVGRRCTRQYARVFASPPPSCTSPIAQFFQTFRGLPKFIGSILLRYYRPGVSYDDEIRVLSSMF